MTKIGVVGAGAFGTGLAAALSMAGQPVVLWGRDGAQVEAMATDRINARYLPDAPLPTTDFHKLRVCDAVLLVVPAQRLRGFLKEHDVVGLGCPLVLCAKGVEQGTGKLQSEVLRDLLPDAPHAVITGPGF